MDFNKLMIIVLLLLICVSCQDNKGRSSNLIEQNTDSFIIEINFPDTVFIGKEYGGIINYQSPLDTIDIGGKDKRYTFLFIKEKNGDNFFEFKKFLITKHDTFVALKKGRIQIKGILFNKLGNNYLSAYIKDVVILDNYYPTKNKARIITNVSRFIYPVYVKDSI